MRLSNDGVSFPDVSQMSTTVDTLTSRADSTWNSNTTGNTNTVVGSLDVSSAALAAADYSLTTSHTQLLLHLLSQPPRFDVPDTTSQNGRGGGEGGGGGGGGGRGKSSGSNDSSKSGGGGRNTIQRTSPSVKRKFVALTHGGGGGGGGGGDGGGGGGGACVQTEQPPSTDFWSTQSLTSISSIPSSGAFSVTSRPFHGELFFTFIFFQF